jgi:predicted short-subunit dehydrogenase-like oxidoreductase (DUF2520 family)
LGESAVPKIGFIGAGTVGTALAILLSRKGFPVAAVSSRTTASAERLARQVEGCLAVSRNQEVADLAQLVFITTPDDVVTTVVSQVSWHRGQWVVHCSGAASIDILDPVRKSGAMTGTIHPLQSLAGVEQAIVNLPGSTFALEAEEPLLSTLKQIAIILKGTPIELKGSDKVLYHAAAVMACNYLVTLVKLATDLWQKFSIPPQQAIHALLPLIQGTLNNLESIGVPECLTGPIARGDTGTIRKHMEALKKSGPGVLSTYQELGRQTIPIALAKGKINEKQVQELIETLK